MKEDESDEWKDEETFRWYRMAEIKRGRVAMLAAVGLPVGAFYPWPGFDGLHSGISTLYTDGNGAAGFGILAIIVGYLELYGLKQDDAKQAGDLGDPLGVTSW